VGSSSFSEGKRAGHPLAIMQLSPTFFLVLVALHGTASRIKSRLSFKQNLSSAVSLSLPASIARAPSHNYRLESSSIRTQQVYSSCCCSMIRPPGQHLVTERGDSKRIISSQDQAADLGDIWITKKLGTNVGKCKTVGHLDCHIYTADPEEYEPDVCEGEPDRALPGCWLIHNKILGDPEDFSPLSDTLWTFRFAWLPEAFGRRISALMGVRQWGKWCAAAQRLSSSPTITTCIDRMG